ncbi:methyltransferase [Corynebacterium choanae]|nr:methyltransferase [Corynebacterium choanae]
MEPHAYSPTATLPVDAIAHWLIAHDYTEEGVQQLLGAAYPALLRGEKVPARRILRDAPSPLGFLIRLWLLNDPVDMGECLQHCRQEVIDALIADGAIVRIPGAEDQRSTTSTWKATTQLWPLFVAGEDRFVWSDFPTVITGEAPKPDHVPGVGQASLTLVEAAQESMQGRVLDVGCGSGILMLAALDRATAIVGIDIAPRAVRFANRSLATSQARNALKVPVSIREGSWFAPVAGERFDTIVANPPFVITPPDQQLTYRASGLELDGATEQVIAGLRDHLEIGGRAIILGSWISTAEQSWQQRIASWFPAAGVDCWVVQRDSVDPVQYVSTWLRDGGVEPTTPAGEELMDAWLTYLDQAGVTAIGMGLVCVERIADTQPTSVMCETFTTPFAGSVGHEVAEHFLRAAWLREQTPESIAKQCFAIRPGLVLEDLATAKGDDFGFSPAVTRLTRSDGMGFSHEVDDVVLTLLKGLHPQGLPLAAVVEMFAASRGLDEEELLQPVTALLVDLIRHGLVLPAALLD